MTLAELLNAYTAARSRESTEAMLLIADILVDHEIPALVQRLAQNIIDRNTAQAGLERAAWEGCKG